MAKEKGKFKRVLFKTKDGKDGIEGKVTLESLKNNFIRVDILNLHQSGLGLNFRSDKTLDINIGDHILLKEVKGLDDLNFISEIKIEIKWILPYSPSRGVVADGEFIDISESTQTKIQQFIDSWFQKKSNWILINRTFGLS